MKSTTLRAFEENDFKLLKEIFVHHRVIECKSCFNYTAVRDWMKYWISEGIFNAEPKPIGEHHPPA